MIRDKSSQTLGEYNYNLILLLIDKLEIRIKIILASKLRAFNPDKLNVTPSGFTNHGTFMAHTMCKKVKATTYISGQSGSKFLDETVFENNNIKILHHQLSFLPYPQFNYKPDEFVPGLSVVDLLFHCGPEAKNYLDQSSLFT